MGHPWIRSVAAGTVVVGLLLGRGLMWNLASAGVDPWRGAAAAQGSNGGVVVAELFTSEGCSSCPPADLVLSRLVSEPVDGTVVLGLGEHVDYWDRLGWRDPFSSPAFSLRQSEYQGQVFGTGNIYTPQLVIDGRFEAIGSDVAAVRRAIAQGARTQKAVLDMVAWSAGSDRVAVRVRVSLPSAVVIREQADVVVALAQDHLASEVASGENRGRRLTHRAVVRSMTAFGSLKAAARRFETTATVPVATDWKLADLRIVGLLQERQSRHIVGAGATRVEGHEGPPATD
jgi:hypothetical protein